MNGKRILKGLIEIYQNDFMSGYEGEDKEELRIIFLELIVEMTRLVNDYRYCSKKNCSCSPEKSIQRLLKCNEEKIFKKILGGYMGLSDVPLSEQREFLREILDTEEFK